ncbi:MULTISPECIES: DUF5627 domain-containing protein [Sphingobacterium]|uniref:DUF5627 domain-containing protein n=1 Tax=Sphingobacterium populi TaxID=1812824 RepID=A0ABW5UFM9_9SPHI|nr:DUF5627 domain-containing protein [Sphingobacterium sp. CFCC 11742]
MKSLNKIIATASIFIAVIGCKNAEIIHPDFDYQTVYFANQYPVRTIVLGEDMNFDTTLDNEKKVEIKATLGGTRYNQHNVLIDVQVNESLLEGLHFENGNKIVPMPANYYSLLSNQINIGIGDIMGGVKVQFFDAFFADPNALVNTYAIPLQMNRVMHADSILSHKDFVFYAVKFINPWHGNYLRRGSDIMTGDISRTVTRRAQYVEHDETNKLTTRSLTSATVPIQFRDQDAGNIFSCTLHLEFDNSGNCTISTNTPGYTATGTGKFVSKGEKNSWANRDRDALYLEYQVAYSGISIGNAPNIRTITGQITTKDTLVMRDRAVSPEYFNPILR